MARDDFDYYLDIFLTDHVRFVSRRMRGFKQKGEKFEISLSDMRNFDQEGKADKLKFLMRNEWKEHAFVSTPLDGKLISVHL